MAPKRVMLNRESMRKRLTLLRERYKALVLQHRQDLDTALEDCFVEEEDFDLITE